MISPYLNYDARMLPTLLTVLLPEGFITISVEILTMRQLMPFLLSLSCYLLSVLAPIVYWLGQTIPLTTHLFNPNHRISKISGSAPFLSTLGSFMGALVTALILFQYAGVVS